MGSCIICGTSVDGRICELHEEDVVFEFRGSRPDELTSGRYYRGSVDGFAEFGVFIDIGDSVTGLLHKSELDQRLESLDWDAGDTVFVQVQNVRDNGNIDLGWSIRQDESEFRGTLIDDPEKEGAQLKEEETESTDDDGPVRTVAAETTGNEGSQGGRQDETAKESTEAETGNATAAEEAASTQAETTEPEREEARQVTIAELDDNVGSVVRIEGEVVTARQTSGPTVFEIRDETGTVDCAAFKEAGVRAYPEVDEGDIVRIEGEVEQRRGELQVETEALVILEAEERDAVTERMEDAMVQRARPDAVDPLADDPAVEAVREPIRDAATAIRRAVLG